MYQKYDIKTRIEFIKKFYQMGNYRNVALSFLPSFKPSHSTIMRTVERFERTGSVEDEQKQGKPNTINKEINIDEINKSIKENPTMSIRTRAETLGISKSTLQRIMHELGYHGYRLQLFHQIKPADELFRLRFVKNFLQYGNNNEFLDSIFWSDESYFTLGRTVNRYNCYYYSLDNPDYYIESANSHLGVMVWCAISSKGIIGPYFFESYVNQDTYNNMLDNYFIPSLHQNKLSTDEIWLMHDGASAHKAQEVQDSLNFYFPKKWMGKGGEIEWPARSPDLTPADFWLWGYLADCVYANPITTLAQLKNRIIQEISKITKKMIEHVCRSVIKRYRKCEENRGGHL